LSYANKRFRRSKKRFAYQVASGNERKRSPPELSDIWIEMIKRITIIATVLILGWVATTGLVAVSKEKKINRIEIGMTEEKVVRLLGPGSVDHMSPACERCPETRKQKVYRGNPSLWYGRLEDFIVVCYVDGIVCDQSRVGL